MIVSGFCKEVFKELPMEFALEAQQLLGITLEGRWAERTRRARRS
jgi:Fe-S cluster assembly protein SufB